jgi:hypothetical protein
MPTSVAPQPPNGQRFQQRRGVLLCHQTQAVGFAKRADDSTDQLIWSYTH